MELLAHFLSDAANLEASKTAGLLIDHYGTLSALLGQMNSPCGLPKFVPPQLAARLGEIAAILKVDAGHPPDQRTIFGDVACVAAYLKREMIALPVEIFRVMFLDGANRLIEDRTMWEGTVDRVQVHVREVVRQALALDAVALVIAHNHVSTPPTPSEGDIILTSRLVDACTAVDLKIADHLIISRHGYFSMRADGVLARLERSRTLIAEQAA